MTFAGGGAGASNHLLGQAGGLVAVDYSDGNGRRDMVREHGHILVAAGAFVNRLATLFCTFLEAASRAYFFRDF